jgi:hypothetical protein
MMRSIVVVCLLTIFLACGKNPNSILPINQMKVVMWDMFNADNWYYQIAIKDSTAHNNKMNVALYQQVFQQDDITKEQFYKSYKYYQSHPYQMKTLLDSTEAYGKRARGTTETKAPKTQLKQIVAPFVKPAIQKQQPSALKPPPIQLKQRVAPFIPPTVKKQKP